ncbi:hypothetical protein GCM10008174_10620 [Methylopila turkensis]|uniref:Uncharacterized protein n=1 Tax=Methylopila turkensis TaxID=1437816 RepID=A0A9W6JKI1_9HYPH|nr:hypothetical protein GCM10008174_10620 [Methylopila turkensis]
MERRATGILKYRAFGGPAFRASSDLKLACRTSVITASARPPPEAFAPATAETRALVSRSAVMAELDPAIHPSHAASAPMDPRVKPEGDGE